MSHQIKPVNVFGLFRWWKSGLHLEKGQRLIVNRQLIPGDIKAGRNYLHPGGIRVGVSEGTLDSE